MEVSPAISLRREAACQALLLLLLLACVFPGTFLRGEMIAPGDLLFQSKPWTHYAPPGWTQARNRLMSDVVTAFTPWRYVMQDALAKGEWPLRNHLQLTGIPLLANCQSTVLYPPSLPYAFLGLHLATTIFIILKLWLCGMTAYVCTRTLKLGVPAARFVSVAWMLSGFNLVWCYWAIPNVSVWFPIIFMGTELLLEGRYKRGFHAVAAGGTLSLLAGHPETAVAMSLGLALYLVSRLVLRGLADGGRVVAVWGGAWALACLAAAPQLLPFIEYLQHSFDLGVHRNVGSKPGFNAGAAACLWAPRFYGAFADRNFWGSLDSNRYGMMYAGIPVWAGISLLLLKRGNTRQRARVTSLVAVCVFLGLFAFEVPPFHMLHRLPLLSIMKRTYHIGFVMFALPLLAAIGLERWFETRREYRHALWWVAAAGLIACVLAVTHRFHAPLIHALRFDEYIARQLALCAGLQIVCLVILLAGCAAFRPRFFAAALTLVLAADLLIAGRGLNPTIERRHLYPDTRLTRFMQDQPGPCRFGLSEGMVPAGVMTAYGIEDLSGYDALYPERIMHFQHTLKADVWNAMEPVYGVRYYLHDPDVKPAFPLGQEGRFELAAEFDGLQVYKNKRALPRAFLVGDARVIADTDEMFDVMRESSFEPEHTVLLESSPPGPLPKAHTQDVGQARVLRRSTTRVNIDARAKEDCIMVVSEGYCPGWYATVDGKAADVFPAYYAFLGVLLPAGEHAVELRYSPSSFRVGLAVSAATLTLSIAAAAVLLWKTRRGRRARY